MPSRNFCGLTLWKVRFGMSTENYEVFTKENLSMYLRELSKEYKRLGGLFPGCNFFLAGYSER